MIARAFGLGSAGLVLCLTLACRERPSCDNCGTAVVAAVAEPASLVPPLIGETVGGDISDQI
jgi:hypothetical protein